MSWFSRRKPARPASGPSRLETGVHRSPGLARLCQDLGRCRPESILDLGASSTENLALLSRYTANLCIQDIFHAACEESGVRSTAFRFPDVESIELPAGDRFDVVLMWDLLHYFEPGEVPRFIARLAGVCQPEAQVLLIASSVASIPLVPIRFKIEAEDALHYSVAEGERMAPGGFTTRQVEGFMEGFEPLRCYQLRNGLQEFLFRYAGAEEETSSQLTLADLGSGG